ncbi:MAG TPA: MFS transporter [Thermoanaerobaculia bacterium]
MPHDSYAALRIANFRRLILGHGTATLAREAQIVVVGWQVYEHTHDPLSLGLIGLAEALPFVGVALYAGHVADRVSRRAIAIAGTIGVLLSAIALLAFTSFGTIARGQIWPVYLVIFLSGIARSFTRPAVAALSAELVSRDIYANAVAWRSSMWHFAAVFGPAIGGLLYGFAGAAVAYEAVIISMCVSLIAMISITHRLRPAVDEHVTVGESLRIGLRFVWNQPLILAAMTLDLFSVLFGGAVALLPIFAHLLSVGPQGLGMLRAAPAAGSVLTGVYLAHRPPFRHAGVALLTAVTLFGVSMIVFALSRNFYLSLAILALSGMADNISVVIRGTLIQIATPQHLLGRVSSVNSIFIGASNEIGAFESGVAARIMGTVPSVIFGGAMTLLVVIVVALWSAPLRRMREIHAS